MNLTDELAQYIADTAERIIADTRTYLADDPTMNSNESIAEMISADQIESACFIDICDDINFIHALLELAIATRLDCAPSLISSQY